MTTTEEALQDMWWLDPWGHAIDEWERVECEADERFAEREAESDATCPHGRRVDTGSESCGDCTDADWLDADDAFRRAQDH